MISVDINRIIKCDYFYSSPYFCAPKYKYDAEKMSNFILNRDEK